MNDELGITAADTLIQSQELHVGVVDVFAGFSGSNRHDVYALSSVTLFIILGLTLFAVIKYSFEKNIKESFMSFFNYRQALRMFEDYCEYDQQASLLSNLLFSLVLGIFITLIFPFFGSSPLWQSYSLSILFFSAAVCFLYTLKARVWQTLGTIFMVQTVSKLYIHNMFMYNRITGLIIFPLVALIPYISEIIAPYIIYVVFFVLALSYIFKFFRIFQIIIAQNFSVLHFILYLCALEILPLLLFVKSCIMLSESVVV